MTIRLLLPFERRDLEAHLIRLDQTSRGMRFEAALSDGAISAYVAGIDLRRDLVLGLYDDSCILRGAVHIAFHNATAEIGLTVERPHRGKGHGTRLLARAVDCSRFKASSLTSQCLVTNGWMMRKLRGLGCTILMDGETAIATLPLPVPDLALACRAAFNVQAHWLGYGGQAFMAGLSRGWAPDAMRPRKRPKAR